MNTCLACKNKSSTARCESPCIFGLGFCGIHARAKNPRIWSVVNDLDRKVTLITKVWRGFCVRNQLKLAGPGVLNRSVCHNEEELVLMEDKSKIHPLDYFAFEEGGKVWWFDIRSAIAFLNAGISPTNPYTRAPLSMDTRYRLRRIYKFRLHMRKPTIYEAPPKRSFNAIVEYQWMRVCQILHENGFEDITLPFILSISTFKLYDLMVYIHIDLLNILMHHKRSRHSRYSRYTATVRKDLEMFDMSRYPTEIQIPTTLMLLLNDMYDVFPVASIIARALARM